MKDDILKSLVTWASSINTLNGVYTLSQAQYNDLRIMQRLAMEALREPRPTESVDRLVNAVQIGAVSVEKANEVLRKMYPAAVDTDRWNGYWPLDVVAVANRLFNGGYYDFAWAEGRLWDHYQNRREWKEFYPVDEEHMRVYGGLRYPEESDYVKLG